MEVKVSFPDWELPGANDDIALTGKTIIYEHTPDLISPIKRPAEDCNNTIQQL